MHFFLLSRFTLINKKNRWTVFLVYVSGHLVLSILMSSLQKMFLVDMPYWMKNNPTKMYFFFVRKKCSLQIVFLVYHLIRLILLTHYLNKSAQIYSMNNKLIWYTIHKIYPTNLTKFIHVLTLINETQPGQFWKLCYMTCMPEIWLIQNKSMIYLYELVCSLFTFMHQNHIFLDIGQYLWL